MWNIIKSKLIELIVINYKNDNEDIITKRVKWINIKLICF